MDLLHQSVKNLRDDRGSGIILLAVGILVPIVFVSTFLIDTRALYISRNKVDDYIIASALGALQCVDPIEMAYGNYTLIKDKAELEFRELLKENLKLDDGYMPKGDSLIVSKVDVVEFTIYNPGEYPTQCSYGTPINQTTIHVVIGFKIKRLGLQGLLGKEVDMQIHRDVDNFYYLDDMGVGA